MFFADVFPEEDPVLIPDAPVWADRVYWDLRANSPAVLRISS